MRKITKESVEAFFGGYTLRKANMLVCGEYMYLHGNLIAKRTHEGIFISNAGWESNTTKERLNGILDRVGSGLKLYQKDFVWYLGESKFPHNTFVKIN